jgi:gliding motility-associated protein GldM
MAGGKESIRQQMINLMYLVLTAMLALQVNSTILDKFLFIDSTLQAAMQASIKVNQGQLEAVAKAAEENPEAKAKAALQKAQKARELTEKMLAYIAEVRKEIIDKAGGGIDPETGGIKTPAEETKLEVLMVGPEGQKNGKAYELEKKLDEYVEELKKLVPEPVASQLVSLTLSNRENPVTRERYKNEPIELDKDWAQANFAHTPVAAALAVLSQRANEVLRYENIVLSELAQEASGVTLKFDVIQATYTAPTSVVANGMKYRAELFIFASASNVTPTIKVNGEPVKVENGRGIYEIRASGGTAEGVTKKWKGEITIPKAGGGDTTFVVEGEYKVVAPVMQIQSKSVQALYEECGNEIQVLVPALGQEYNPSFSGQGAVFIPGRSAGDVTIVPSRGVNKVVMSVSSGGQLIGTQEFAVKKVPAASLALVVNGREIEKTLTRGQLSNAQVIAKADPSFAEFLPKEANYRVQQYRVEVYREGRPVANANSLQQAASSVRPGDTVVIIVESVVRSNYRGAILPAEVRPKFLSLVVGG